MFDYVNTVCRVNNVEYYSSGLESDNFQWEMLRLNYLRTVGLKYRPTLKS